MNARSTPVPPAPGGGVRAPDSASEHLLLPGRVRVPERPEWIVTITGSGVAVCLWDSLNHIGGACHFLLPMPVSGQPGEERFGISAVPELVRRMQSASARTSRLRARIFGGANPFSTFRDSDRDLGRQNLRLARSLLENLRILNIEETGGGAHGLKIRFHSGNGDIHVERLAPAEGAPR